MPEPYYATVADLRALDEIPAGDPPSDAKLLEVLEDAEDLVDRLVAPAGLDTTTGRAITTTNLEAWQADKLMRATRKLAALLYADPAALQPPRAQSIKGPAFELTNLKAGATPAGETAVRAAVALLDQAGLRRRRGARATV